MARKRRNAYSGLALVGLLLVTVASSVYVFKQSQSFLLDAAAAGKPNLVVSSVTTKPAPPVFGSEYDVIVKIKNTGTATPTSLQRPVTISVNNDTRTAVADLTTTLAPGAEESLTFKKFKSKSVYTDVIVTADTKNKVPESNEADNSYTLKVVQSIPGGTPTPVPKPTLIPGDPPTPPGPVTNENLKVFQEVVIARPDTADPNNYYYFRIVGTVQNDNPVSIGEVRLSSTFESWFSSITQPQLTGLQVVGLPKSATYNGVTDLNILDMSSKRVLMANDNKLYGPDQAQVVFDIRVKRYKTDVKVQNLLTFQGWASSANKGLFSQSLIPITIPAKVQ